MKVKLTPTFIEALTVLDKRQHFGDTEVPGLVLVVQGTPKKKKLFDISISFYFNNASNSFS